MDSSLDALINVTNVLCNVAQLIVLVYLTFVLFPKLSLKHGNGDDSEGEGGWKNSSP